MSARIEATDKYQERIGKLVPSEIIAFYITFSASITATHLEAETQRWIVLGLAGFCLLMVSVVLLKAYQVTWKNGWMQHLAALGAFVLWAFNVSYDNLPRLTDDHEAARTIGALLLGAFTFGVPYFVQVKAQEDGV